MIRNGNRIVDDFGRTLILRGVNLGGSSKIPFTSEPSLSFAGRPFPIENAGEHFSKLKNWGFSFIRLIITWEALEHSGPGTYDEAYIDYLEKILLIAEKHGISVFVDPHQDVWSRFTGGDGAPAWTLEKLGMDIEKLDATGSAINSSGQGKQKMIWPVNYSLYAAATMFTLFFAGNTFAPSIKIEGESAQDYLQSRYIAAFRHCCTRLKNCKAIKGWGIMNEPHPGFIGYSELYGLENVTLALGPVPSAFQAMLAASGMRIKVPVYTPWLKGWKITGKKTINPYGLSLFKEGFSCPWKQEGIWTLAGGKPELLKPEHFSEVHGRPVRFTDDFLKPFFKKYIALFESINDKKPTLYFLEGVPHAESPYWGKEDPQNVINAFHHYDGITLFTKSFKPYFTADSKTGRIILGKQKTAAHFSAKLNEAKTWARDYMGDMPCFLGEFGLPFDMNKRKAYKTGDYSLHEKALSIYYDGIDENLLSSTIWNYTADNTHEAGDHWNGEDLSIVANGEPRAMAGWLRPYPMATAGQPLEFTWKKNEFFFRYKADSLITAPTEIFLPAIYFGENPCISIKTNECVLRTSYSRDKQSLFVYNDGYNGKVELCVYDHTFGEKPSGGGMRPTDSPRSSSTKNPD